MPVQKKPRPQPRSQVYARRSTTNPTSAGNTAAKNGAVTNAAVAANNLRQAEMSSLLSRMGQNHWTAAESAQDGLGRSLDD